MPRLLVFCIAILLAIYCVVEAAQTSTYSVRTAPKWMWIILIICIPVAGPISWLLFGRPTKRGDQQPPGPPPMPDNDPDFLRKLKP